VKRILSVSEGVLCFILPSRLQCCSHLSIFPLLSTSGSSESIEFAKDNVLTDLNYILKSIPNAELEYLVSSCATHILFVGEGGPCVPTLRLFLILAILSPHSPALRVKSHTNSTKLRPASCHKIGEVA
jgi:hypothetical protein